MKEVYENCYACFEPILLGEFHPCDRPGNCTDANCPVGSTMVGWPHPKDLETCSMHGGEKNAKKRKEELEEELAKN